MRNGSSPSATMSLWSASEVGPPPNDGSCPGTPSGSPRLGALAKASGLAPKVPCGAPASPAAVLMPANRSSIDATTVVSSVSGSKKAIELPVSSSI